MDIFIINTNDVNHISENLLKQFEHKTILNKKKWQEHCLSYLMLDRILKEVYQISDREIEFINEKPYLKNKKKFFSISHSGDFITVAFSDYDCGIDIEKIEERPFKKIAERMNFKSESLEEFYLDWTKYEAEYKLNDTPRSLYQFMQESYAVTAVCSNIQENFEIYIQNGEQFPNLESVSY